MISLVPLPRPRQSASPAPVLLAGLLLAAWTATATAQAQASVQAPPGAIVRWEGDGITQCSFQGRAFAPLDGACIMGLDLDAEGSLQATRTRAGLSERLSVVIGDYPYPVQRLTIKDTSRVNLSPANQQRAARERARLLPLFDLDTERQFSLPLQAPLEKMPKGGRFGSRRIINGEPRSPHTGADFAVPTGTPVMAAADGVVGLSEEHFFSGNSIFIDHGDGLVTMYFHLDELFVARGERVTRGSVIGTVGSTGRSTGPHLHFGARWRGARIDPLILLGQSGSSGGLIRLAN